MHFATDATLGKLGRHLRAAGFDTVCQHESRRETFFDALDLSRIILTRTTALLTRYQNRPLIFIQDNDPLKQMKQVIGDLGIRHGDASPFSRCLICNRSLHRIDKNELIGRVPAYVWQHQHTFYACAGCERIYWPGSHHDRMHKRFNLIFKQKDFQTHARQTI